MNETHGSGLKLDRDKTRKTVLWGVGLSAVTKVGSVLISLVLARMLAPEIFGQYGTVNAVILIVLAFSMHRYAEHVFHLESPSNEDYFRHLSFGSVLHVGLFIVANLVALGFWLHPTLQQVALPLHIVSLAVLLNIPRIYYTVHLRRLLNYRKLRSLQIVSFALSSASSVLLAWLGFGVYALLSPNLLVPIPYVVSFLLTDRNLIGWNFDWRAYKLPLRFGLTRTASVAVDSAQVMLESLLFSMLLGFTTLGLFTRARGLAQLATSWVSDQVVGILHPALAQLPNASSESRRASGICLRIALWSSIPVATTIAMNEQATVRLLYGDQWDALISVLRPVLAATTASCIFSIISLLLLTNLGPHRQFQFGALLFGVSALGMALVLPFDWRAYVVYIAVAYWIVVPIALTALTRIGLFDLGDIARACVPGLLIAAAGVAIADLEVFDAMSAAKPNLVLFASAAATTLCFFISARFFDTKAMATICGLLPGGAHLRRMLLLPAGLPKAAS